MNNKITNPETEVSKGLELNDKDYLTNLLVLLKDMEKNLVVMLTELSNEKLYNIFEKMFLEMSHRQRKCYELAFKNGWYPIEAATSTKIKKELKTLNNELVNLDK